MAARGQPIFLGPIVPVYPGGVNSRQFEWFCGAQRHTVVVAFGADPSATDVRRRMSQAPDRFIIKNENLFEAIWNAVIGESQ